MKTVAQCLHHSEDRGVCPNCGQELRRTAFSPLPIRRYAEFSPCATWRYTLIRKWDDSKPRLLFVLLNPSTADAVKDDPTNRRGIGFARRWGFGSVVFVNLFAFRTPDPKQMKAAKEPVGPENDAYILREAKLAKCIVAAWGNDGSFKSRAFDVRKLLKNFELSCLGTNMNGEPKHPLYLSNATVPGPFAPKGKL